MRLRSLARVPFFARLDDNELAAIEARCGMRGVEPGEAVHLAGRPATHLTVVAQGVVKLTRPAPDGRELLTDVAGPGGHLGTLPALGEERYVDSAWALTPGCLLRLGVDDLAEVLDAHPQVTRDALRVVAAQLREAQSAAHRFAAADAEQRVAAALLLLVDRLGVRRDGARLINAPLGRDDLAGLAACAPETVSRVLSRLRRDGVLDTGRRWVAVRDRAALEALASLDPAGDGEHGPGPATGAS